MDKIPNNIPSDVFNVILCRRSVRSYKKDPLPSGVIDKMLEAASWAPSGLNNQPWRFMVITQDSQKESLARFTKYGSVIKSAPVIIVVCMDIGESYNREKDLMSIGACIQNMMLQAYSMGIGTCWLGEIVNKKEKVAASLKLDSDLEVVAVVAAGYPQEKGFKGCRKPLTELKL